MLKFIVTIIFCMVFICQSVNCEKDKWNLEYDEICELSYEQWRLISWYFERVKYIELTQIVVRQKKYKRTTIFSNYLSKSLYQHLKKDVKTFVVDFNYEDVDIKNSQTYEWHTNRFEPRDNTSGTHKHPDHQERPYLEDDVLSIKSRSVNYSRVRDDEPAFGSIVIAENIYVINNYLDGKHRHPFRKQRVHYIILVYKHVDKSKWDKYASSVMTKLWKDHGILNGIVLASCKSDNVGYYDPYVNLENLNLTNVDKWGVFRCVPLKLLDLKDDWILRKDSFLNGFPLVASMFLRFPTAVPHKKIPPVFLTTQYAKGINFSKSLGGFDGIVLGNLAEVLRFDLNIIMPQESYGRQLENKTFTG